MRFPSDDLNISQRRTRLGCKNLRSDLRLSCCANINAELNVDGLCRDLPRRIQQLVDLEGDRLKE